MTVTTERATPAAGTFPRPIPLGERAVGWLESEIDDWIEACLRKRDSGVVMIPGGGRAS